MIKTLDTSTDLTCRFDSPSDRPNGEEDDNTSLEVHAHEIEGDINDNAVHDESQDGMDQAPYSDDEFNGNQPDPPHPSYDDEAYQEQLNNDPSDPSHRTDHEVEETYANDVEPVNKCFEPSKPASYYRDGWEERSPPPPATQLQARQRVALPVVPPLPKYPHVLEIIPHWTQFADPHADKNVPFCKPLAQGGCSQGDRCRFRHSLTVEEYILLFNDQQPNLWTLHRDGVNDAAVSSPTTSQPQVDSPHISPAVVAKSSIFRQECKFHPIGTCRNGKDCPYQHTQHPKAPVATVSNADLDRQTSERPAFGTRTQNFRRPCRFHFEQGNCTRGLSCRFSHGNADGDHPSSGPSGPEPTPSLVDDNKTWSTGRENKAINNSDADTAAEKNGWGLGAPGWEGSSNAEDHDAWDSPSGNDHNHQSRPQNSNVCFRFAEGYCPRGKACRYSHDQEFSSELLSSEPPHMSHEEKAQEGSRSEGFREAENPTNEPGEIVQNETQSSTWEMEKVPKTLSENEPKAQEGDPEDSHILDNEATWVQSSEWHTETVQPPPFPIKINAPCKRFGQGYCPFRDDCTYMHIIEDTDIVEHTSNLEGDVSVSIFLNAL